ncbi:MAG: DNA recombination protein RmuC [candidate division Zixibacteria bacterium]|nr:DNA recombination protein RmuC [candidate division Zixibacteria bacterium]
MEWITLLIGLVVGGVAAWLLGRAQARESLGIVRQQIEEKDKEIIRLRELYDTERVDHAGLKSRMQEAEKNLAEMKQFAEESKKVLEGAFASLSKEALTQSKNDFLQLAKSQIGEMVTDAKGDFSKRQEAIDGLLKPINESLKKYDEQVQRLSQSIQKDYGSVDQHLKFVKSTAESLQRETGELVKALRAPQVRGRWGEFTLRRAAELAGMAEHCDFVEQEAVDSGRLRPDMTIYLPGGRNIVVDAKVSLTAYLDMLEATDEDERKRNLARHASHVREHMKQLGTKSYWSQFDDTPDFVVMFIPAESFFSAAVEVDHTLIEDGLNNNVILSSPTTFIALLRTVALGWRQEQMAENAAQVSRLGAELYDRINRFAENFNRVGKALESAVSAFNDSAGTLEARVLVSTRRFRELGATAQSDIKSLKQVEQAPRSIQADEPTPSDPKSDDNAPERRSLYG